MLNDNLVNYMVKECRGEYNSIEYKAVNRKNDTKAESKTSQNIFDVAEGKKNAKLEKEKNKKTEKIYSFIKEHEPYYYQARDIHLQTGIKSNECTQIVTELLENGRIQVTKKGKDRIFGATLETVKEIEEAEVVM